MLYCLLSFLFAVNLVGTVTSSCNRDTCRLGGECKVTEGGEEACVCPTFPCTPEMGSDTVGCGSNGVTYPTICELRQAMCAQQTWIDLKHIGPCGTEECLSEIDCTYGGRCIRGKCICTKCRDVIDRRIHYGPEEVEQNPDATRAYKRTAVCGTDDVTYDSVCHLNYHACKAQEFIYIKKRGLCRRERHFLARSQVSPRQVNIVERPLVVQAEKVNCTRLRFKHCASRRHPRLPYMGTYSRVEGLENLGSPVYKLVKIGSTDELKDFNHVQIPPVFLSRHVTELRPNGFWIVGSKVSSGRGWLGVADPSPLPEMVTNPWQSTRRNGDWTDEDDLTLECDKPENYDCLESIRFDQDPVSNWQTEVTPPTPYYVLQLLRPKRGKYRSRGKIIVELRAKKKWRQFQSYIIKLTTDRASCGTPKLQGSKNRKRHEFKCGGTVLVSRSEKKKMMRVKLRFQAPKFGCITISAIVLSKTGYVYEDDILTKTVCSKKS